MMEFRLSNTLSSLSRIGLFLYGIGAISSSTIAATQPLEFPVTLSKPVTVTGAPRIPIDVGGATKYATYTSGSGTPNLTFTYTMATGDVDLDGIALTSPIDLNGGTIKDANGNNAVLTYTPPNTSSIKINYPSFSIDFTNGATGRYTINGTVYNDFASFLTASGGAFARNTVATYFDNTGTMQISPANTVRLDYDPTSHVFKGALIEEARTNYIRNSNIIGSVAGSPGTSPTGWGLNLTGGGATATTTIVGNGTINGMRYIDVRSQGNMPATSGYVNIVVFDNSTISITNTASLAASVRLQLMSGTIPTHLVYYTSELNGATYLANRTMFSLPSGTINSTLQNFSGVTAAVNASVDSFTQPRLVIGANGTAYAFDFTLRIATPQVEIGGSVTSFIPTSGSTAPRSADSLIIPTGSWFNDQNGTLYMQAVPGSGVGNETWVSFLRGISVADSIFMLREGARLNGFMATTSGTAQRFTTGYLYASASKAALAYKELDDAMSVNGAAVITNSYNNAVGLDNLRIGQFNGARYMNGWVKTFKYYPSRVSNTQLQLLTQ